MKSKITSSDFFCILEMMRNNVELKMNVLTYKKILGKTFGVEDFQSITNPIPCINGIKIDFESSMNNDVVTIIAKYIPHTREKFDIEII